MSNLWQFDAEQKKSKLPYEFLTHYASLLKEDTNHLILGQVLESVSSNSPEVTYSLYLIVPKLRNYSYRLIEVKQPDIVTVYPVEMRLYGTAEKNVVFKENVSEQDFEKELVDFITSPLTKLILHAIKNHIDISESYKK